MRKMATDLYKNRSNLFQGKLFSELISLINMNSKWKCVDIGCGTGYSSFLVAQKLDESGKVLGIDPNAERILSAIETYKNQSYMSFRVGYGQDLSKFAADVDLVTCSMVLHWLKRKEKEDLFKNVSISLKSGGIFAFNILPKFTRILGIFYRFMPEDMKKIVDNTMLFEDVATLTDLAKQNYFQIMHIDNKVYTYTHVGVSLSKYADLVAASMHCLDFPTASKLFKSIVTKEEVIKELTDEYGDFVSTGSVIEVVLRKMD